MINESKLLITWWTWRLWRACKKIFPNALYPTREELNVLDEKSVDNYFQQHSIEYVLHLVALASIPACESDKVWAWNLNVGGTRNILLASRSRDVKKFIYLQSACIFSWEEDWPYDEDSIPNPKHYYWITKLVAEEAVRAYNSETFQTIVVRTNFTTMPWEYPKAFTDRYWTYLFAQWVAKGIKDIFDSQTKLPIIHICWEQELSLYEYAILGWSSVEPMTIADYNWPPLTKRMSLVTKYWHSYRIEDSDCKD